MNYAYGNAGLHGLEKVIIESPSVQTWLILIGSGKMYSRTALCEYSFGYSYIDSAGVNIVSLSLSWRHYEYYYGSYGVLSKNSYSAKLPATLVYREVV